MKGEFVNIDSVLQVYNLFLIEDENGKEYIDNGKKYTNCLKIRKTPFKDNEKQKTRIIIDQMCSNRDLKYSEVEKKVNAQHGELKRKAKKLKSEKSFI